MTLAVILRFWLPLSIVSGFAFLRGGGPEKVAAGMLMGAGIATLVSLFCIAKLGPSAAAADRATTIIDIILFAGLIGLSVLANRLWPMLLTALHGITVLGHLAGLVNNRLWRLGYDLMTIAPAYPGLLVLLIGVIAHLWRIRRWGVDRPWRISWRSRRLKAAHTSLTR